MIWIIGGTGETLSFIERLENSFSYVVTVATYAGKEVLPGKNVVVGRMDSSEMDCFLKVHCIDCVVDLSHPFAVEVSRNAKDVARKNHIPYFRYLRKESDISGGVCFDNFEMLTEYLKNIKGTVFFTTGIKNITDFEKVKGGNRFVYRITPTRFAIDACLQNKIEMKDIVAMLGPFSLAMNKAMFDEFGANYIVMKNSGKEGGTEDKMAACRMLAITPLLIGRLENEEGYSTFDDILKQIGNASVSFRKDTMDKNKV